MSPVYEAVTGAFLLVAVIATSIFIGRLLSRMVITWATKKERSGPRATDLTSADRIEAESMNIYARAQAARLQTEALERDLRGACV